MNFSDFYTREYWPLIAVFAHSWILSRISSSTVPDSGVTDSRMVLVLGTLVFPFWAQSKNLESNLLKVIHQSFLTINQFNWDKSTGQQLQPVESSHSKVCQFEAFGAGFFASFSSLSNSWTLKMWLYFIFHKCLFSLRIKTKIQILKL